MLEIATDRLILREPVASDADALYERVFSNTEAMRYIGNGSVRTIEQARASIDKRVRCLADLGVTLLTVIRRTTGEIVGDCGILPIDWKGPELELAYRLTPTAWGQGFATEAGHAVMEHVWRDTTLATIFGVTDLRNRASQRVLTKLGFEDIGTTDRYYGDTLRLFRFDRPGDHPANDPA